MSTRKKFILAPTKDGYSVTLCLKNGKAVQVTGLRLNKQTVYRGQKVHHPKGF